MSFQRGRQLILLPRFTKKTILTTQSRFKCPGGTLLSSQICQFPGICTYKVSPPENRTRNDQDSTASFSRLSLHNFVRILGRPRKEIQKSYWCLRCRIERRFFFFFFFFFFKYVKWSPVYHVSTIFENHVTAGVLWVKMTFQPACEQTKWRPDRTKFGGEIVS